MEFRALKYFLAVARTENISHAAAELNISQPALSRQLMDLEEELGVKLLSRSKRRTTLTEAGYLLKKRAEELSELMEKTTDELSHAREGISGNIHIGCGETAGMRSLAQAIQEIRQQYPNVHCHLYSMDGSGVKERLEKGTLDFGVLIQPQPPQNYGYIELPHRDVWGIYMKKDSPLSVKDAICAADLDGLPLIVSQQAFANQELQHYFGKEEKDLNIVATYNLIYNASLLVEAGIGYLVCLDELLTLDKNSQLVFRPLKPQVTCRNFFVWKRNQVFSGAAMLLKERMGGEN